ncbi:hypothetical protein HHK36_033470 [Tetracentron sinense]|uniref:Uncharacterized protein n=1 Tax=Tetracentron sinense TaxID=13715 RepID=A0A835CWN2_TETSI|nr:hypothetical protein HHK36_033470 [Tetracentron sinense]
MATVAAEVLLKCVFEGCISMQDMEIERRPYHRNCSCALHKSKGGFANSCSQHGKISYSKKESWKDCCLSSKATPHSSSSSLPLPGNTRLGIERSQTQLTLCRLAESSS